MLAVLPFVPELSVLLLTTLGSTLSTAAVTGWPQVVTGPGLPQTRTCSY